MPCWCSITSAGAFPMATICGVWAGVWYCLHGFAGARFTVVLLEVDNSITEETDLRAEWMRWREMTAWSSSDQHCLVMTPWCVHQGHTKQTLPPFIALHHLYLCSLVGRLTDSLYSFCRRRDIICLHRSMFKAPFLPLKHHSGHNSKYSQSRRTGQP